MCFRRACTRARAPRFTILVAASCAGARVNIAVLEAAGLGVWFDEAAYEAASGEECARARARARRYGYAAPHRRRRSYAALLRAVGLGAPALDDICARAYGGAAGAE